MAQNKFEYFDEQEMTDPMLVPVGTRHMGTDLFNTVNGDIYGEFKKATMVVLADKFNFAAFVDAVASLNIESTDNQPEKVAPQTFAFINGADTAELRKNLAEDLKYVEAYARSGYVGTVAGVNIYTKKDATKGTVVVATRQAVTIFNKKGVEIEQERDADHRKNDIYSRKYYLAALTDATGLNFLGGFRLKLSTPFACCTTWGVLNKNSSPYGAFPKVGYGVIKLPGKTEEENHFKKLTLSATGGTSRLLPVGTQIQVYFK